ncbi:MAG: GNAT family N-acetyltransferase, partial [Caulobacterales bacterium]
MTEPPQKLRTPVLETARLHLRPMRYEDSRATQEKFPHWEVVKYLNAKIPWPYPEGEAGRHLAEFIPKMEAGELSGWAICLRNEPDELIGRIDLRPYKQGEEMRGFWLAQEYWSRGLMTEAANRVTDFAFRDLGFA